MFNINSCMYLLKRHITLLLVIFTNHFVLMYSQNIESDHVLNEVKVIANRYKEVIPSQKLEGETLESLSSFSVADAIRYFSGVQIKDYGGIGGLKTVDIRSMGTNHMGVFYDGIQLGNAQNGQIDLGKFSLDNIEEISLYNGQKSEIFQSAKDFGSSGTIYLRTRRPRFIEGKKSNIVGLFRTGSFGLYNSSLLWEQKLTDEISSSFNIEHIKADGKYKFRYRKILQDGTIAWDTTAVRQNGDIGALRLEGGFTGYMDDGKWSAKAYYYDSEKGIPGAIVNNVWKNSQRQWDRNFFTQGNFQKHITSKYETLVNAKFAHDYMRYLNPDTTLMMIDNQFWQKEIYISSANKYKISPLWDISVAVDYQWNFLDATLQDFVHPQRNTLLAVVATAFEWNSIKGQASFLGTFVNERVTRIQHGGDQLPEDEKNEGPSNRDEYTPALFISYKPFKHIPLSTRAFYKRIFRMPTFNDLYYTDIGNVLLNPEFTTQYNVGLLYETEVKHKFLKHFNFKADGYYNEVTDKIIAVPKGNGQYRWMMMNIGFVEIRGLELSTQLTKILPYEIAMRTSINYTFQKAQDFTNPEDNDPESGTYGSQIAYIPWHNGSIISNLLKDSWELNYSFIYVGERYHNSSNIRENHEQPWYTHDLNLGKSFEYKNIKYKISAEVNNLLNQYYDVVLNYPMPGRNYKLILKVEI